MINKQKDYVTKLLAEEFLNEIINRVEWNLCKVDLIKEEKMQKSEKLVCIN